MTKLPKKKIWLISILSFVGVLIVALIVAAFAIPVTYKITANIEKVNTTAELVNNQKYTTLTKDYTADDDSFKVISFTDLHLDTYAKQGAALSLNLMIENIVKEQPDLVVFVGDIITSAFNANRAKQFADIMDQLGVYWTLCLGNHEHDNDFSITRETMIKMFVKHERCIIDASTKYTSDGTKVWGNGNHVINILDKDDKICQSIYMLDGGQDISKENANTYKAQITVNQNKINDTTFEVGNSKGELEKEFEYEYDFIKESQIAWYKETADDIKELAGGTDYVNSTLFCHIPVYEFNDAWVATNGNSEELYMHASYHNNTYAYTVTGAIDLSAIGGSNQLLYGERREFINSPGFSAEVNGETLFELCKTHGTKAIFAGHDHVNDFICKYDGIVLGYVKAGGYTQYNTYSKKKVDGTHIEDHLTFGYTNFEFKQDGNLIIKSVENKTTDDIVNTLKKK